jgi:hypothetical protein
MPGAFAEKDTTAWMQEVERRREQPPSGCRGQRAGFCRVCPHPGPLPQGEGEKQRALFNGRISNAALTSAL